MNTARQTRHLLHEEHRANLDLLGRIELVFARAPRRGAGGDAELVKLVAALARQIEADVDRHFEFEERELFTRLAEAGEGDIAGLLREEHEAMREVAGELLPLARAAAAGTLDDAGWEALKRGAFEYTERQVAHIQKEEMALLPMLEDLLDDDTDRELALGYASS
jgi:hemerythrin-like domain-containing protein